MLEDEEYEKIVDQTITEVRTLTSRNPSQKWEVFLLTLKTKSIQYCTMRNRTKRRIKNALIRQITEIEENQDVETMEEHYAYMKGRQWANIGSRGGLGEAPQING